MKAAGGLRRRCLWLKSISWVSSKESSLRACSRRKARIKNTYRLIRISIKRGRQTRSFHRLGTPQMSMVRSLRNCKYIMPLARKTSWLYNRLKTRLKTTSKLSFPTPRVNIPRKIAHLSSPWYTIVSRWSWVNKLGMVKQSRQLKWIIEVKSDLLLNNYK